MGDALVTDQWVDHGRIDAAQADVGAAGRSHRPGVGPAVAVEHRQGPEIDRIAAERSEEHTSELQALMRSSYAVFCLKKKNKKTNHKDTDTESLPTKNK